MAAVLCVGHAVQDFVFRVGCLPTRGEKYRAHGFFSVGGGPAANAAVTVARLGGHAVLAARVGADTVADAITAELAGYGVDCSQVRQCSGAVSSLSAVMLDDVGERMIVNHLDPAMPTAADWLVLPPVDAVLGDVRWPEGSLRGFELARRAGLPAILDADRPVPADGVLLSAATHVAFSRDGLADLTGSPDAAASLTSLNLPWACVTLGADGVLSRVHGGDVEHHSGFAVRAVDTLGAGDVWHGAFALALAEAQSAQAAIRFAQAAAALKVSASGGRAAIPVRSALDAFLKDAA